VEQFIDTVDTRDLPQLSWPILEELCPGFVEQAKLHHHVQRLLASKRWRSVRVQPQPSPTSWHLYSIYGVVDDPDAD
jgi:hypothetical protein